ncbi:unnamed protein product [Periconia digitata]|uniref:Uncharacterized protein n=1 Tax=Periconia digitata TaxID=1303443 RepID=A0A9W4UPJ9_9PLEO|nr:unnamed protein product [Periconia digitata]
MLRRTITSVISKTKPTATAIQTFSTVEDPRNKARTQQIVEQAQNPSESPAYKTIKEKTGQDQDAVKRSQMVGLAQQSHANGTVVKEQQPSPHTEPWSPHDGLLDRSATMITIPSVWPHMW